MSEVQLDFDRGRRTGLEEAVFAQGKSPAQLDHIFAAAEARRTPLLVTRLAAEKFAALDARWAACLDYCARSGTAFFGGCRAPDPALGCPAIVAAGSSDAGVAREAERTLRFSGIGSTLIIDVGVAGLWRLTARLEEIAAAPLVIAVAGMDAALPTVLGGLIGSPIIAVPTSVGYGVATGGHAALHAILASCASGIAAVNIDNGYGGACAAIRMLRAAARTADRARRNADEGAAVSA